jgi:hypothetical protein
MIVIKMLAAIRWPAGKVTATLVILTPDHHQKLAAFVVAIQFGPVNVIISPRESPRP